MPRFAAIGALRVLLQMMIAVHNAQPHFWRTHSNLLYRCGSVNVAAFFAMSALLSHQKLSVKCSAGDAARWVAKRVWRLMPAHILVVALAVLVRGGQHAACGEPTVAFEMFLLDAALPARSQGLVHPDGRCVGLGWYVSSLVQLTVMTPGLVLLSKRTWGLALLALALAVPRLISASVPALPWTQVLIGRGVGVEPWLMGIFASLLIDRVRNMSPTPQNGTEEKDEKVEVVVVGEEEHAQEGTLQKRRIAMPAIGLWLAMLLTYFTVGLLNAEQWRNWGSYVCTAAVPMISLGLIIADVVMTPSAFYDLPWLGTMASVTYEAYLFGAAVGTLTYTNLAPALGIDDVRLAIPLHLVLLYMLAYPIHRALEFFRKVIEKHASALCCSHRPAAAGYARVELQDVS
eukprot:g3397.t1